MTCFHVYFGIYNHTNCGCLSSILSFSSINFYFTDHYYILQDFTKVFHQAPDVVATLRHHIKLRKQLRIISHRHRFFIISFLITATASQFWTLLSTTRPHAQFNLFVGGELFVSYSHVLTYLYGPFQQIFFYINFHGTIADI
jgi:IS1 family transposase